MGDTGHSADMMLCLAVLCCIRVTYVSDMFETDDDGTKSRIFVSKSYDATSHFQTVSSDVRSIYKV